MVHTSEESGIPKPGWVEDIFLPSLPSLSASLPNIMLFSVAFTAIFLIANHFYSTFAWPVSSKDVVVTGQSLGLTHSLVKRVFIPPDQKCREPAEWNLRRCLTGSGYGAWEDECVNYHDEYYVPGNCPEDTMCMNTLSPEPDAAMTIACVGRPSSESEFDDNAYRQTGVFIISNAMNNNPVEHTISVPLVKVMSGAAVSAFMEGTDGDYAVAANVGIIGSLHGTTSRTCLYDTTNRDCVPTIHFKLGTSDNIDFTFGIYGTQVVRFYYGIFGNKAG